MVLSYALRGSTGFGAAAAMPLLALVIPLKVLIPAWTLIGLTAGSRCSAAIVPTSPGPTWRACCRHAWSASPSGSTSSPRSIQPRWHNGVLIVVYGAYSLWLTGHPQTRWQASPRVIAPIAGAIGGAVGTTFGTMASVFFAIYFDVIRMAKDHFRASMSAILVALGIVRALGYWAVGEYTREVLITVAIALPMILVGIFIGNRIHTGLSDLAFRRLVSGALIVCGLALVVKSG